MIPRCFFAFSNSSQVIRSVLTPRLRAIFTAASAVSVWPITSSVLSSITVAGMNSGAPDPMTAEKITTSQHWWRSCRDDPPQGWMLAVKFYPWHVDSHDFDLELVQFHDGKWWGVYENSDDELEITMYDLWMPAAAIPAEAWE